VVARLGALEDDVRSSDRGGGLDGVGQIGGAADRPRHGRAGAGHDGGLDAPAGQSGDDGTAYGAGAEDDMSGRHDERSSGEMRGADGSSGQWRWRLAQAAAEPATFREQCSYLRSVFSILASLSRAVLCVLIDALAGLDRDAGRTGAGGKRRREVIL